MDEVLCRDCVYCYPEEEYCSIKEYTVDITKRMCRDGDLEREG